MPCVRRSADNKIRPASEGETNTPDKPLPSKSRPPIPTDHADNPPRAKTLQVVVTCVKYIPITPKLLPAQGCMLCRLSPIVVGRINIQLFRSKLARNGRFPAWCLISGGVGAFNISLALRKMLGAGTPRELRNRAASLALRLFESLVKLYRPESAAKFRARAVHAQQDRSRAINLWYQPSWKMASCTTGS